MGPYIVTTKRPVDAVDAGHPEAPRDGWPASRLAVATLEEDELAERLFDGRTDTFNAAYIICQVSRLPESGGTISLPDGTVIEVALTKWIVLAIDAEMRVPAWEASLADRGDTEAQQRILDAYNAQQKAAA